MDIHRAEKLAQDYVLEHRDWDKRFLLIGPGGIVSCTWLDPYFGMFQIDGSEGFVMTKQIPASVD
ncbi:MAG: hypothetical protein ACEQSB_07640, partial [Undibacterium sp.]